MANMRIGIDIRPLLDSARSGIGEYTQNLLKAIFETDKTNQYFLFYNVWNKNLEKNLPKFDFPDVKWCATRWPNKVFNFSGRIFGFPKFDKIIEHRFKIKLDLFFCPNFGFISLSKNIKKIVVAHDLSFLVNSDWFSLKRKLWHKTIGAKRYFKTADSIVAVSENTKRDLVDFYNISEEKIKVIYPGIKEVKPQEIGILKKFDLPAKFIFYLGTIEPRKNVLGIIKAFEAWKNNSKIADDYFLVLAGARGWLSGDVWKAIADSPFKNKIKYLGYVAEEDKFALYHSASLFLYPSFYEGFGLPPLEAMSCGVPVIASANSSFPEVLGDAAFLVNPYDLNDIANGIEEVLSNQTFRELLIKKGEERVEKFSWQKAAEEWTDLVNRL